MAQSKFASLASQLGDEPCLVEDTEEMFWLRELDDYQSRMALGNALAGQYRFKEAMIAYEGAKKIRRDDWQLYNRLGGASLTLRRFGAAWEHYQACLKLGAPIQAVALQIGVWHYLQGQYRKAAKWFARCLPCGDELAIAAIYWHTLSCYRCGEKPELLSQYHKDMDVGHHTAYRLCVSVFSGETDWRGALEQIRQERSELNIVISLYGLSCYLGLIGEAEKSASCLRELLEHDALWPCIAYLAAWNDIATDNSKKLDGSIMTARAVISWGSFSSLQEK